MPQELSFFALKDNRTAFGNFFPAEIDLDYFFPEETAEDKRIAGESLFLSIDEISDEDIDTRPDFQNFVSSSPYEGDGNFDDDTIDDYADDELYDLVDRFGDGEFDKPAFADITIQPEEKEDKKSVSENFVPFSKTKIKCEVHKRPHGHRGRNDRYKNISRKSLRDLSLSI